MKQGTLLYLGMLLLLGGGFEAIRRFGMTLTPPRHIAGFWRVPLSSSPDPCPILEFKSAGEGQLQIEQSGRYLHLVFPDTHHTRLRAYFSDGALHGTGPSTHACADGTLLDLNGHMTENRLDLVLTRAVPPSGIATASLSLSATRPTNNTVSESTQTQLLDPYNKKE